MSTANDSPGATRQFSSPRFLCILAVVGVIAAAAYWYGKNSVELPIPNEGRALKYFGLSEPFENRLAEQFVDKNNDLVADAPTDPADWKDPDTLFFSYGSTNQAYHHSEEAWSDLMNYLSEQTGKPVEFVVIETPSEQVLAIAEGRLHVAGTNPGSVPLLVNACGFVPVCAAGKDGRIQTYQMQIIVPADSPIAKPRDLYGRMITFTDPSSSSGWKAPLVVLMREFGLQPMRDYLTNSSGSHIASIKGIAAGEYEAAAVASTEVILAVERGDIEQQEVKSIYASKSIPYDCLGYVHNLQPSLADKIREALLSFDWSGTTLEEEFKPLGFHQHVPLSYQNDLAMVREIDNATGLRHSLEITTPRLIPSR